MQNGDRIVLGSEFNTTQNPQIGHFLVRDNMQSSMSEPVPEPSTMVLLGLGLVGMILYGRKFNRKK